MPYAPLAHDDTAVRRWIAAVLIPDGGVSVAVDTAGRVLGMMAIADRDGACWLEQLYVSPTKQGRGIGAALLAELVARTAGPIRLYCFEDNHRARAFYERHGFLARARRDGSANEEGCPDWLYERSPG
jgi:ribosomal protein S18 acetylase RimI-like enzyme